MMLDIMKDLEEISEKFKKFIIEHDDPVTMVTVFLGLFFLFLIGQNVLHKKD